MKNRNNSAILNFCPAIIELSENWVLARIYILGIGNCAHKVKLKT